jgi:hypothetical protein
MKYWMYSMHTVQKLEGPGQGTSLCNDFKRAKVLFCELLGWSGCSEELCFDKDFVTNLEVWWWNLVLVCGVLILFLCRRNGFPKFLV